MKLMTKRLLAVVLVIAMTLCMTISAMADWVVTDDDLRKAGLDPAKAVKIAELWVEVGDEQNPSPKSGQGWTINPDGTVTIDFRYLDLSQFSKVVIFHFIDGQVTAIEIKVGPTATFDSASPFVLYGEKIEDDDTDTVVDDDDADTDDESGNDKSHHSKKSSSKSKSPKTGMNDSWMLWLMAAGVFTGASVVAYNKKKR